jgi:hypothetical protein
MDPNKHSALLGFWMCCSVELETENTTPQKTDQHDSVRSTHPLRRAAQESRGGFEPGTQA